MAIYDECYSNQALWMSIIVIEIIDEQELRSFTHDFKRQIQVQVPEEIKNQLPEELEYDSIVSISQGGSSDSISSNSSI